MLRSFMRVLRVRAPAAGGIEPRAVAPRISGSQQTASHLARPVHRTGGRPRTRPDSRRVSSVVPLVEHAIVPAPMTARPSTTATKTPSSSIICSHFPTSRMVGGLPGGTACCDPAGRASGVDFALPPFARTGESPVPPALLWWVRPGPTGRGRQGSRDGPTYPFQKGVTCLTWVTSQLWNATDVTSVTPSRTVLTVVLGYSHTHGARYALWVRG